MLRHHVAFLFLLFPCLSVVHAQPAGITQKANRFRAGDRLVKKQIDYIPAGRSGEGVLWDVSQLYVERRRYPVSYLQGRSVNGVTGVEHNTRYYYKEEGNLQLLTGYENNQVKVCYSVPETTAVYPMSYGDEYSGDINGYGIVNDRDGLKVSGLYRITADAWGALILPAGDTLRNVVRVRTFKETTETPVTGVDSEDQLKALTDSLSLGHDAIVSLLAADSTKMQTEIYKWYAKGYRYPVLESQVTHDGTQDIVSSYYYPPSEQEYIAYDEENHDIRQMQYVYGSDPMSFPGGSDFRYNVFVSQDGSTITLNYSLGSSSEISFGIYGPDGSTFYYRAAYACQPGVHMEEIPLDGFHSGMYIVSFDVDGQKYSCKITSKG